MTNENNEDKPSDAISGQNEPVVMRSYLARDKRTDTERLEWTVRHKAVPMKVGTWGLWCVDFRATNGRRWFGYSKEECTTTMREAVDNAMDLHA